MNETDKHALTLLTRYASAFLREAKRKQKLLLETERTMRITLSQFDNSPLVLYAALHYAGSHGITVIVAPSAP